VTAGPPPARPCTAGIPRSLSSDATSGSGPSHTVSLCGYEAASNFVVSERPKVVDSWCFPRFVRSRFPTRLPAPRSAGYLAAHLVRGAQPAQACAPADKTRCQRRRGFHDPADTVRAADRADMPPPLAGLALGAGAMCSTVCHAEEVLPDFPRSPLNAAWPEHEADGKSQARCTVSRPYPHGWHRGSCKPAVVSGQRRARAARTRRAPPRSRAGRQHAARAAPRRQSRRRARRRELTRARVRSVAVAPPPRRSRGGAAHLGAQCEPPHVGRGDDP
jgi:hypothetical protein